MHYAGRPLLGDAADVARPRLCALRAHAERRRTRASRSLRMHIRSLFTIRLSSRQSLVHSIESVAFQVVVLLYSTFRASVQLKLSDSVNFPETEDVRRQLTVRVARELRCLVVCKGYHDFITDGVHCKHIPVLFTLHSTHIL